MRLRRWFLDDADTLVAIVSWRPSVGPYGIEWPTMRIDERGYRRRTISPVWNWARIKAPFTT